MFADGPVAGKTVLVQGILGGVGSMAAQLARWGGATVIGTVTRESDVDRVDPAAAHPVALDQEHASEAIRRTRPDGVDRIIEVALSDNADLDADVIAPDGIIAAYSSRRDRPAIPFWPMLFANATVRLIGSDDFPPTAKRDAANDLTTAAERGGAHDRDQRAAAARTYRRSSRPSRRGHTTAHPLDGAVVVHCDGRSSLNGS